MESFSSKVKKELSELNNLADKNLVKYELQGYLLISSEGKFSTENEYNINRFAKLLENNGISKFNIEMQGNKFCITFERKLDESYDFTNEDEAKALVRGAFLGSGSITNPKNNYHLEIIFESRSNAEKIKEILNSFSIESKVLKRNKNYIIYIKDGEDISNFLALVGANKSVLEFEQTRVMRDVRNNINRLVNCETANLNKVAQASVKQAEDIKIIKENGKFKELNEGEREIANLRLENLDATLSELGQMLEKPIGKSGVNHRLKHIAEIADEIRNNGEKND